MVLISTPIQDGCQEKFGKNAIHLVEEALVGFDIKMFLCYQLLFEAGRQEKHSMTSLADKKDLILKDKMVDICDAINTMEAASQEVQREKAEMLFP